MADFGRLSPVGHVGQLMNGRMNEAIGVRAQPCQQGKRGREERIYVPISCLRHLSQIEKVFAVNIVNLSDLEPDFFVTNKQIDTLGAFQHVILTLTTDNS